MKNQIFLAAAILSLFGLFGNKSHAQASAGTYSILTLGTRGTHATDPGSIGTMTITRAATGNNVSGTVYNYGDKSTATFAGRVNLVTGVGTIIEGGNTIDVTFKTYTSRTVVSISYSKRNSTSGSKGVIWGIAPAVPLPAK